MNKIIDLEETKKTIWLLDRKTAMHIVNMVKKVENGHTWYLQECPQCGGQYIDEFGHDCEDTLRLRCSGGFSNNGN